MSYPFIAGEILTAANLNLATAPLVLTSYTPTLTNIAKGTGGSAALDGAYARVGNCLCYIQINLVLGTSGASVTGTPTFSVPSTFTATQTSGNGAAGLDVSFVSGGSFYKGMAALTATTSFSVYVLNAAATYVTRTAITNLIPGTWAAGDLVQIKGFLGGTF